MLIPCYVTDTLLKGDIFIALKYALVNFSTLSNKMSTINMKAVHNLVRHIKAQEGVVIN